MAGNLEWAGLTTRCSLKVAKNLSEDRGDGRILIADALVRFDID